MLVICPGQDRANGNPGSLKDVYQNGENPLALLASPRFRYSPPHGSPAAIFVPVDLRQRRVHRRREHDGQQHPEPHLPACVSRVTL